MIKIYVDANIYLDFLLDRKNKQGVPLCPKAWNMFHRILTQDYVILLSLKTLEEIDGELRDPSKARMLFEILKKKIEKIAYTPKELQEAEKLDKDNRNDALHAILANKYNAGFLVTRNIEHFKKFKHLINFKLPEDV